MSRRIMNFCENHGHLQLARPSTNSPCRLQLDSSLTKTMTYLGFRLSLFAQRKDQNNRTPGMRARSTQLLLFPFRRTCSRTSIHMQWLGFAIRLALLLAIDRSNAWTALRRPLAGRSRSLNHPDRTTLRLPIALRYLPPNRCRGAKQYFSCLLTIPYFAVRCKSAEQSFQQRIVAPGL